MAMIHFIFQAKFEGDKPSRRRCQHPEIAQNVLFIVFQDNYSEHLGIAQGRLLTKHVLTAQVK